MSGYLDHMNSKPAHERRRHAMRVAGIVTAFIFVGWVTTLGLRLGTGGTNSAQVAGTDGSSQAAAAVTAAYQGGNQLIVSTTTAY